MLKILKGVKLAQEDSTGDVYAIDCHSGPKKLIGGSSGSGMSYDVIVTSADGGTNFALYAGSYEAAKNKILNKECLAVSIYIDATAEAPIQVYKNFSVLYTAETELIVINYLTLGGALYNCICTRTTQ